MKKIIIGAILMFIAGATFPALTSEIKPLIPLYVTPIIVVIALIIGLLGLFDKKKNKVKNKENA